MKQQMYRVIYERGAMKDLEHVPHDMRQRIFQKVNTLAQDEIGLDIKKMKGYKEDTYRLRVGDYRVIYRKIGEELIILVLQVGHRKEIYE